MAAKKRAPITKPTAAEALPTATETAALLDRGVKHLEQLLGIVQAMVANGEPLTGQLLRESAGVVRAITTAAGEQRQARKAADAKAAKITKLEVVKFVVGLEKSERGQLIHELEERHRRADRSVLG